MSIQTDISGLVKDKMSGGDEAETHSMEAVNIEEKKAIVIQAPDLKLIQESCDLTRTEGIDLITAADNNIKAALIAYLEK